MECLDAVSKVATFFGFSEVLKRYLETWKIGFLRRQKEGHSRFLVFKLANVGEIIDKRGYTTANFTIFKA